MYKLLATVFGIGYIPKGGGTVAAVVCCLGMYFAMGSRSGGYESITWVAGAVILLAVGIAAGNKVEKYWGKDSYRVVIDEVAGMWISMMFVPVTIINLLIALVLFRIFDIWKPLYIRNMEKLPGGTGVMMDDVLAGVYSCLIMHIILKFK